MKDDDEALRYLERRGIEPGVIEVLRSMLGARSPQVEPASKYGAAYNANRERRSEEGFPGKQERLTKQKRCFLAAVNAIYPAGVPEDTTDYKLANDVRLELAKRPKPGWWCEISGDTLKEHAKHYIENRPRP